MPPTSPLAHQARRRTAIVAALLCASARSSPLLAQAPPERRTLAVNVIHEHGAPVRGLTTESFRGEYRGKAVAILSVSEDREPRSVALVLDWSGSMAKAPAANLIGSIAENAIASLTPRDRLVVATLADGVQQRSPLTSDPAVLREGLARVLAQPAYGATALYDGVVRASRGFGNPGFADAICVLTDGEDTTSKLSDSQAAFAVAQSGLRLFVVHIPTGVGPRPPWAARWMRGVAEGTGGQVLEGSSMKDGGPIDGPGGLRLLLRAIYRLEVAFPGEVDKAREWDLEVVESNGKKMKKVQLTYPRVIVPAPRD